jgi:hypothetical protein
MATDEETDKRIGEKRRNDEPDIDHTGCRGHFAGGGELLLLL